MRKLLLMMLCLPVLTATAVQGEELPDQAINVCAVAIPVMNMYVINYENLLNGRHGLDFRLEYNPMSSCDVDEATGLAAVLDYRYHFAPRLESFFAGPYMRYRTVNGSGIAAGTDFEFDVSEVNLGLNAGYRWIHDATGISAVFSYGYGHSWTDEEVTPMNGEVESAFDDFKKENETYLDAPFFGELSIGYAF